MWADKLGLDQGAIFACDTGQGVHVAVTLKGSPQPCTEHV